MSDPSIKNLREWVGLLFCLFCVLDVAAVQYGVRLAETAAQQPNLLTGQIMAILGGQRGTWHPVYVTAPQVHVLYGLLSVAALSLFATLALIVAHGIRRVRCERRLAVLTQRK